MITEDYVSFETAKLLKEKGFDEVCYRIYDTEEGELLGTDGIEFQNHEADEETITAPTLQMAMKWLKEVQNLFALNCAEYCYNNLICKGWKPQQAREVLPLATKSQLIHTAFVDDWKHFFALRADGVSGPVHPNAKLIAKPLKKEFIKHNLL